MLLEFPLGRHDAGNARVDACRLIERPTEGLENRLDDVVQVLAIGEVNVNIRPGVVAEGDEKQAA